MPSVKETNFHTNLDVNNKLRETMIINTNNNDDEEENEIIKEE